MVPKVCSIPECGRIVNRRDLCRRHYEAIRRNGEVVRITVEDRFWAKVSKSGPIPELRPELGPCWIWTGSINNHGYGRLNVGGKARYAHRIAWELKNKLRPGNLDIDHICHNPPCVNPSHLRAITHKQNGEHRKGPDSDSSSGILGVCYDTNRSKWLAQVAHNGRRYTVGRFDNIHDAEAAAIAKRNELFTHNDHDRLVVC